MRRQGAHRDYRIGGPDADSAHAAALGALRCARERPFRAGGEGN